jgi:hypothetical protein
MPQAVTITSLPRAFELVKAMPAEGLEWGEGYRGLGRNAIAAILQGQMAQAIEEHLDHLASLDQWTAFSSAVFHHQNRNHRVSSLSCSHKPFDVTRTENPSSRGPVQSLTAPEGAVSRWKSVSCDL